MYPRTGLQTHGPNADVALVGTTTGQTGFSLERGDIEITSAAMRTYGRLVTSSGGRVIGHPFPDGGVICEDRTRFARPTLWRIRADGRLLPDNRYSFMRRGFVTTTVPDGVGC